MGLKCDAENGVALIHLSFLVGTQGRVEGEVRFPELWDVYTNYAISVMDGTETPTLTALAYST